MAFLDAESIKGLIVILLIIWILSGAGMRMFQKLVERLLEDL